MTPLGLRNGRRGGASQDQRPVPRAPVVSLLGPAAFKLLRTPVGIPDEHPAVAQTAREHDKQEDTNHAAGF